MFTLADELSGAAPQGPELLELPGLGVKVSFHHLRFGASLNFFR